MRAVDAAPARAAHAPDVSRPAEFRRAARLLAAVAASHLLAQASEDTPAHDVFAFNDDDGGAGGECAGEAAAAGAVTC